MSQDWFEILTLCRTMTEKGQAITSSTLAALADFPTTVVKLENGTKTGSTKEQIASAWLGKLTKWKYLEVSGKVKSAGNRPANTYSLTQLGLTCERRDSKVTKPEEASPSTMGESASDLRLVIAKLIDALSEFAVKRGTPQEETAFQNLLFIAEEVKEKEGLSDGR